MGASGLGQTERPEDTAGGGVGHGHLSAGVRAARADNTITTSSTFHQGAHGILFILHVGKLRHAAIAVLVKVALSASSRSQFNLNLTQRL